MEFKENKQTKISNVLGLIMFLLVGFFYLLFSIIKTIKILNITIFNAYLIIGIITIIFILLFMLGIKYMVSENSRMDINNNEIIVYYRQYYKFQEIGRININEIQYIKKEIISYTTPQLEKYYLVSNDEKVKVKLDENLINLEQKIDIITYLQNKYSMILTCEETKASKIFKKTDVFYNNYWLFFIIFFIIFFIFKLVF